jgi:hypothetical protein
MSKPMLKLTVYRRRTESFHPYRLRRQSRLLLVFDLSILLSACAGSAAQIQMPATIQNKAALLEALETAKRQDWSSALDPRVATSEEEDFLDQMNKADRAIKELTHGFEVPQSEIDEALVIPPKSLPAFQRVQLIRQLQDAVQQDDRNEQAMLNDLAWSDSAAPADTFKFDQQKALANGVIKDLEIGEDVHWSTIKEALVVPQSPY